MRIVHLPFYSDNPYQKLLIEAQRALGHEVIQGGGGGYFLRTALREWQSDTIHFHWLHPYLLRPSRTASIVRSLRFLCEVAVLRVKGTKIVWTIHNLSNHAGLHPGIEQAFSTLFARFTDRCFVHSHDAASAAIKRFHLPVHKVTVIPHGHYIGQYPNSAGTVESRRKLGLPLNKNIFLFFGRIEQYKGVFELIDAFVQLKSDSHLVIAGKSPTQSLINTLNQRAASHPNIHIYPARIPDDDIQIYFNAADVVIFPFRKILTSGSLVLAMSFGKAIIAPDFPSLKEIVPPLGALWFHPGGNPSLIQAMQEALTINLAVAGAANLEHAKSWDWLNIAKITTASVSTLSTGEKTETL